MATILQNGSWDESINVNLIVFLLPCSCEHVNLAAVYRGTPSTNSLCSYQCEIYDNQPLAVIFNGETHFLSAIVASKRN